MLSFPWLATRSAPVRILGFVGVFLGIWLPYGLLILWGIPASLLQTLSLMIGLYAVFALWLWVWGRRVHQVSPVFSYYGLRWRGSMLRDLALGLSLGMGLIALMFGLQWGAGWLDWQATAVPVPRLIWEGGLVGLAVAIAEELLFRGWLLDELQRDYAPTPATWSHAAVFAALHFIKPLAEIVRTLPQFLGLVLLGVILGRAKQRTGQLGLSIGLHGGLVWGYYLVNVGDWVVYTNAVPQWVTGINQNPLAGLVGLSFLVGLLVSLQRMGGSQATTDIS